jgi:hypothetical protein
MPITLTKTRHTAATGIYIGQIAPGLWQHVQDDRHEADDARSIPRVAQVGPHYKTKAEALADHEAYMVRAGWLQVETQPVEVKADGEANFYSLLNGSRWLARMQLNGEFTTAQQETIMQAFATAFPKLQE